jgi:hypothetical protein
MNRQLKFRIWDKQNKKWLKNSNSLHCFSNWTICPFTGNVVDYVGAIDGDHGETYTANPAPDYYITDSTHERNLSTFTALIVREPRYVIQQYTGLKDSKGVEIYEGDIVEIGDRKREVIFNIGMFYIDENYGDIVPVSEVDNIIEVIGNIFENPVLIKNNE